MARQVRAQITREAIIRGAGTVFANVSYSTATLADVIREAGVTQGALYFHFDSKQELALEVIKRQHETSLGAGEELLGKNFPGVEAMIMLSTELARQITTDPVVRGGLRLSTESAEMFPSFASRPYLDWINACEMFLNRALGEGDIVPGNTAVIARFIISSFTGVQVVSQALSQWEDIHERLAEMWALILPAIVVPQRYEQIRHLAKLADPASA